MEEEDTFVLSLKEEDSLIRKYGLDNPAKSK
jgi:hypothetical protein